jgi:hypothetical protein
MSRACTGEGSGAGFGPIEEAYGLSALHSSATQAGYPWRLSKTNDTSALTRKLFTWSFSTMAWNLLM